MSELDLVIRPIAMDEWLPDRCLGGGKPIDPTTLKPEAGCSSLCWFYTATAMGLSRQEAVARPPEELKTQASRHKPCRDMLEDLYREAIEDHGGCGFVAWLDGKIVGYHNFFPREIARKIRFFGWGHPEDTQPKTLVHNCVTHVRGPYSRKHVATRLIQQSICWAAENGWQRFEVHLVLPDCEEGWQGEQKGCTTFWEKLGFEVYRSEPADDETKRIFGVDTRYSMFLTLNE